jgi:chemotaxis protein MotB
VTKALTGFADKGLNVDVRDGKVYVSLENKLLFPSASWTVSRDGVNAIKELAKVLEQDSSLNIMVEGHTDNDAYRGSTAVKDNWDLSVMRATSIVKLLLQHGPSINPARIEACGHGEFAPKADNSTAEGKAANRRTEIILTPNLDKLLRQMGN